MRLKYNISDLEGIANKEGVPFEEWLLVNEEYYSKDGIIYYLDL